MPLITRLFIKSGLIFFVLALLTGIAMQVSWLRFPSISPLFWHMLMVGWITQIIMGISMWMFPGRKKEESFQNQKFSWIAYAGLNIGLALRVIAEPLIYIYPLSFWDAMLILSAGIQFVAIVSYVIEIWPRVMSKKQRRKKRRKER